MCVQNTKLEECMKKHKFKHRGKAYFRVVGDGVLQIVKFVYEPGLMHYELNIGLMSLYSELKPQWLTSSGCIPQYSISRFIGKKTITNVMDVGGILHFSDLSIDEQLKILYEHTLPILDTINTQDGLCEWMRRLETVEGASFLINDMRKFAPFLKIGNLDMAKEVIQAILDQHAAGYDNEGFFANKEIGDQKRIRLQQEDAILRERQKLAKQENSKARECYLSENYAKNCKLAKFCM